MSAIGVKQAARTGVSRAAAVGLLAAVDVEEARQRENAVSDAEPRATACHAHGAQTTCDYIHVLRVHVA